MSAHDWPEFEKRDDIDVFCPANRVVIFDGSHREFALIDKAQYNYAKVRIDACAGMIDPPLTIKTLLDNLVAADENIETLEAERDALQAKLDAVMLEYCPDEMTQEQTEKWASSQVVSDNSELDAARLDNQKLREFIEYWSHDSRLMTFESRQVFRSGAEQLLASETFTQALAAQQEAGDGIH